eukprot:TRINITY_DN3744_c0_g1_i5.p1 TRINITY_DN3744_c0_g1~~TRINITY_DN3744_c0_g1_i5.p1  ORF type:complete len:310 (+),score=36.81 TRINITY_DN3744_c0_g1_i5:44-973(+)
MSDQQKVALITGITGQDGFYLNRLLQAKGYIVHGTIRSTSKGIESELNGVIFHEIDWCDAGSILKLVTEVSPDEIYNLAAQSSVSVSFSQPEYTTNVNAMGTIRLLDAVRLAGLSARTRIFQASSSEMFGKVKQTPQTEETPFRPQSPYGVSKQSAFWHVVNYREGYGLFACNGILFNHESPRRADNYVTRKITQAVANISLGRQSSVALGNLSARRDWGHAADYVRAMHLMLQYHVPDDFVIATGDSRTIRQFAEAAFALVGIELAWRGCDLNEVGYDKNCAERVLVTVDPKYVKSCERCWHLPLVHH